MGFAIRIGKIEFEIRRTHTSPSPPPSPPAVEHFDLEYNHPTCVEKCWPPSEEIEPQIRDNIPLVYLSTSTIIAADLLHPITTSGYYNARQVHRRVTHKLQELPEGAPVKPLLDILALTTSSLKTAIENLSRQEASLHAMKPNEEEKILLAKKELEAVLLTGKDCILWKNSERIAEGILKFGTFLSFSVGEQYFSVGMYDILSEKFLITRTVADMDVMGRVYPLRIGRSETRRALSDWGKHIPLFTASEPCFRSVQYQKNGQIYQGAVYVPSKSFPPLKNVSVIAKGLLRVVVVRVTYINDLVGGSTEIPIRHILGASGFELKCDFPAAVKEKIEPDSMILSFFEQERDSPPVLEIRYIRKQFARDIDEKLEPSRERTTVSCSSQEDLPPMYAVDGHKCSAGFELHMVAVPKQELGI